MGNLPIRDEESALRVAGGNRALASKLFDAFIKELPRYLEDVGKHHGSGNFADLKETAHQVRGSTSYCGAPALGQAAKALEIAALDGDSGLIDEKVSSFKLEVARLMTRYPS